MTYAVVHFAAGYRITEPTSRLRGSNVLEPDPDGTAFANINVVVFDGQQDSGRIVVGEDLEPDEVAALTNIINAATERAYQRQREREKQRAKRSARR